MSELEFVQVGGRCKLKSEEDFTSYLKESTTKTAATRIRSLRREWQEHQRSLREKARLADFLKKHGFAEDDLDAPKFTCLGLKYTWPVLQAAREGDEQMVLLLVRCGANPLQRDIWGYTAIDYVKSPARSKIRLLYVQSRVGQGLS